MECKNGFMEFTLELGKTYNKIITQTKVKYKNDKETHEFNNV